jgi:hypothetical protein
VLGMVMSVVVFSTGKWKKKMYALRAAGPELD